MTGGAEQIERHPVLVVLLNLVFDTSDFVDFLFGFRVTTLISENLSVEEEVDELWECGCSCIPSQSTGCL